MSKELKKALTLTQIPGDKSISHRAIIIGSLAENDSTFTNFLFSKDCLNTAYIFQKMGVPIILNLEKNEVSIKGVGLHGLKDPKEILDVGNAGTGIRLITGILAGQKFKTKITGDASIQKRPMKRIVDPLRKMGAKITGIETEDSILAPLEITPSTLSPLNYTLPVASAQVKSCLLFSALYANGKSQITEIKPSRNHTEVILNAYGATLSQTDLKIEVEGMPILKNPNTAPIPIPSDFSSAAFFIVLALLSKNSTWTLKNISLNKTRTALLDVLIQMGANITVIENKDITFEPVGDIIVSSSTLKNIHIPKESIPILIDEIPILAIAGLYSEGRLILNNAEELRVKESDRIKSICNLIKALGGQIEETEDGFMLTGNPSLQTQTALIQTEKDHRIAMAALIAGAAKNIQITLDDEDCIATSFPNFNTLLKSTYEE